MIDKTELVYVGIIYIALDADEIAEGIEAHGVYDVPDGVSYESLFSMPRDIDARSPNYHNVVVRTAPIMVTPDDKRIIEQAGKALPKLDEHDAILFELLEHAYVPYHASKALLPKNTTPEQEEEALRHLRKDVIQPRLDAHTSHLGTQQGKDDFASVIKSMTDRSVLTPSEELELASRYDIGDARTARTP